jgi:cytochrome c oxidase subunit IV
MSEHGSGSEGHQAGSTKLFVTVWVVLAVVTAIEVWLGYMQLQPTLMLSVLVVLSLFKAALIVAYFMHLKYERFSMTLTLIPATIFCIMMMVIFFFHDSERILLLGTQHPLK